MHEPDIGQWLDALGLGRYRDMFAEQAIDFDILPQLDERDLSRLDLPLGHRKRLLSAIAALDPYPPRVETPPAGDSARERRPDAERRQLTVLQCDMVGSTRLASELDPEDLRRVMGVYFDTCVDIVNGFGGFIARYMGDGLMAYFGYPAALEDAAERAVRAGLKLAQAVPMLSPLPGVTLHVRIGIATGLVVVGDLLGEGTAREEAVVGETPARAARLEALAPTDGVAIASTTRHLVRGMFDLEHLGLHEFAGFPGLTPAWRVAGEAMVESRFAAIHHTDVPDSVGRDDEVALLLSRWEMARESESQFVLLSGEPGIGKSRICMTLAERLAGVPHSIVRVQCSPFHGDSALYPFINNIERGAGIVAGQSAEEKLDRLARLLAGTPSTAPSVEKAPDLALFASLLSIPTAGRLTPLDLPAEELKQRIHTALLDRLFNLSRQAPVLVVLEDAHWIDPTSEELMVQYAKRVAGWAVMTIVTFRPEYRPPWSSFGTMTVLNLNRLSPRQSAELARRIAGTDLPEALLEQIVAKTDGVPLFIEELTKAILESGLLEEHADQFAATGRLPNLAIPATLQDILLARLDRLAPSKAVAQIGAAIGREFSYELLAALTPFERPELDAALHQLTAAELISAHGAGTNRLYIFKHALVQDAAYGTLLHSRRQVLHTRIAGLLQERFPHLAKAQPELLAHHFTEAGMVSPAIEWWRIAAVRAAGRSANAEAINQFNRALGLLAGQPDDPARDAEELELRQGLIEPLYAKGGYAAPEVEANYVRLLALGERLGETTRMLRVMWGRAGATLVRCDFPRTHDHVASFIDLAVRAGDVTGEAAGIRILAFIAMATGEFHVARRQFEGVLATFERQGSAMVLGDYLTIPRPTTCGQMSLVIQQLGFPDQARALCARAHADLAVAGHHLTACYALFHCALRAMIERDAEVCEALTRELMAVVERHHVHYWQCYADGLLGWALASRGETETGLAGLRESTVLRARTQTNIWDPLFRAIEAELLIGLGRSAEAAGLLDDAEAAMQATGQFFGEAELYRLRGMLVLATGGPSAQAEAHFARAAATARRQGAKLWELRAATSQARMWRDGGRIQEARALLQPVRQWFTEGHATADLREAETLLRSLA